MSAGVFASLIREHFHFLILEYGFSVVQESEYHVCFESAEVFLTVSYDAKRSYELNVFIGQTKVLYKGQKREFSLGELLRTEDIAAGADYRTPQVSDPSALAQCIAKLARIVSLDARDYLLNSKFSFARLSDQREVESGQDELETILIGVRREAQAAWQRKDYSKVVSLYKPVEEGISEAEKMRLKFAQKHAE